LATFAEILVTKFFSTRHGDQNGHSLERCQGKKNQAGLVNILCLVVRGQEENLLWFFFFLITIKTHSAGTAS